MLKVLPAGRIRDLDLLRGIAILLMVFFHLIYDLNVYYQIPIPFDSGIVYYMGKAAASLFIIIAGVSCSLSRSNVKRGLVLLFWAIIITTATAVAVPGSNIFFGILHLLAACILLYPLFRGMNPYLLLLLGTAVILARPYVAGINMQSNLLAPLGLLGETFYSADYYPLIPWFGLFLCGIALGKLVYKKRKGLLPLGPGRTPLEQAGQHSLTIYLLHQPILLLLLYAIFYVFK